MLILCVTLVRSALLSLRKRLHQKWSLIRVTTDFKGEIYNIRCHTSTSILDQNNCAYIVEADMCASNVKTTRKGERYQFGDVIINLVRSCFYHIDVPKGDQDAKTYEKSCLEFQETEYSLELARSS